MSDDIVHMESAKFEVRMGDDGKTITVIMHAEPEYCCYACLQSFLMNFFRQMKKEDSKDTNGRIH